MMKENKEQCTFNKMIDCREENCEFCGWNPKVKAQRIKNFLQQKQEIPDRASVQPT